MSKRTQSLDVVSSASIGKSVAARPMNEPGAQASRFVSVQASFHGCREAEISTQVSLSGSPGDWIEVGRETFTLDHKSATYESEIVFVFIRSVLVADVEPDFPVDLTPPEPVETVEASDNADGSSSITTTVTTLAPPPVPRFGVSTHLGGY